MTKEQREAINEMRIFPRLMHFKERRDESRAKLEAHYLEGIMDDDEALLLRAIYREEKWRVRDIPFITP